MSTVDLDGLKITGEKFSLALETRANTFHMNGFNLVNAVASDLYDIELLADNKPIQRWRDMQQINEFMYHYDRVGSVETAHCAWFHERPELQDEYRYLTSLGTLDVGTLVIKGKIKSAVAATIEINPYAVLGEVQPLGVFTRIETNPYSTNKAGEFIIADLPVSGRLVALHIEDTATTVIDEYRIKYNRQTEKEGSAARFALLNGYDRRNGIPNTTSIEWTGNGNPLEAYEIGPRRFTTELDFADNADKAVDIIVETYSTFGG